MKNNDVIIIHPPAIFDFRKKPMFTGALGSTAEQVQFNKVPIGMLSMAEYLDRHGFKVVVDNLADRMLESPTFDPVAHLRQITAPVIGIGLNFQQHAPGALEVARICKQLHPDAVIVLGGLTASRFHQEIIEKYPFVDAVIRGEGEKPLLQLVQALGQKEKLGASPNLTWRDKEGQVRMSPMLPASVDLDEFEYTRLDLLEPRTSVFPANAPARWSLTVCRGCVYNCAICGGSAYSYKTHMGMSRPAFRSPGKILEDIRKLTDQGVRFIGLYQDPRMGGEKYWRELLAGLAVLSPGIERLSLDMLVPADEEFIREAAKIGRQVVIHICPDTGSDAIRKKLGRPYDNEELLKTIHLCHKYGLPVTSFFSVGLAGETPENIQETWDLWEKFTFLDRQAMVSGKIEIPLGGPIVGPIVIDPGAPAWDQPEKYGYKLLYKNLEEYVAGLSHPSWHHWLNYETAELDGPALVDLIFKTVDFSTQQRHKTGVYTDNAALAEQLRTAADRYLVGEVDQVMAIENRFEREEALKKLKEKHIAFLNRPLDSFR
ncbi:MAG: radical SAM protein [Desulfuromonadales bacterium]|nr:radical SAM protein [Desulfuromonadales bacterium]